MNRIPKPTEVRYHLDRTYLNEPMRYGDISLIQIGRLHCTPHTTIETHPHLNWFELTIITDGKGVVGTNGESISVKSGDIHLSFPGDFHQIAADPEDPLKCDFLSFWPEDPALLEELETAVRRLYPAKLRLFSDERIAWQVSNAISELNTPASHSEKILQSAFLQIVLMLLDDLERNTDLSAKSMIGHPEELCFQMMYYIDTHLYAMRSLHEVTDSLGYSYSYLSNLFRQTTGGTLESYYRTRRMEAARLLIQEARMKIGEIADLLHYSSIYTFSRAVRDQFGVPPSDLRKGENNG